jgi:hypothetical protein
MLGTRRFVCRFDLGHGSPLLTFQFGPDPFSLRPQRLAADLDPSQFNDRLPLGLEGTMSEALCGRPHRAPDSGRGGG